LKLKSQDCKTIPINFYVSRIHKKKKEAFKNKEEEVFDRSHHEL